NFIPTGEPESGLGTGHYSLEPSLLYFRQLSDRWQIQAQLTDWIPIGGSDFQGNVVEYGVGVSFLAVDGGSWRLSPVVEFLGWSVLGGKESDPFDGVVSAAGDTIVNGKIGARIQFGSSGRGGQFQSNSDLYIGYGRALTGDVWYKDIFRVEFRLFF